MIRVLFICHGTTSVSDFPAGCQLGKSVQIVALWQVPYYGFTTIEPLKNIYVQIPVPGQLKALCDYAWCLFWNKVYFIVPLF